MSKSEPMAPGNPALWVRRWWSVTSAFGGESLEVVGDEVPDVQPAHHLQFQNGSAGELLGDGSDGEDGFRCHQPSRLPVGGSVTLLKKNPSTTGHQRRSREARAFEAGHILVQTLARIALDVDLATRGEEGYGGDQRSGSENPQRGGNARGRSTRQYAIQYLGSPGG